MVPHHPNGYRAPGPGRLTMSATRWQAGPLLLASPFFLASAGPALAAGPTPYLKKSDDWFAKAEAKRIADAILSHQSDLGGWPKNTDTTAPLRADAKPG